MHKPFYASGFIYHSPSQQILLQQLTRGTNTDFVLFRGKSTNGETPQLVFQKSVESALGMPIPHEAIHPVYDYIHPKLGEHFIFFLEIADNTHEQYKRENALEWILLSKLSKYRMSEQTRHDITIGERVIRSLLDAAFPTSAYKHT